MKENGVKSIEIIGNGCGSMEEYKLASLLTCKVKRGEIKQHIESITNPKVKEMVLAEYYYFCGRHDEAAKTLNKYLDCDDLYVRSNAWFMYTFCNLTLCKTEETRKSIDTVCGFLKKYKKGDYDKTMEPMYVFLVNAANILLDLRITGVPLLDDYVGLLPAGFKVFACYLLSMQSYQRGEYYKGTGIVDTCFLLERTDYVVPSIYLYLAGAMNAMGVDNTELGKEYFTKAYELAKEDGLFEPIGENHGLLHGLVETCLKKKQTKDYEKIIAITYKFSYGWRRIHNPFTGENVADTLSTTEFAVAMLAKRGWSNKEIAEYMELNVNTIKGYMASIFDKLGISCRKELTDYMLK